MTNPGLRLFIWFAMVHLVFATWPTLDLAVSRLFHVPGQGFPLAQWHGLEAARLILWAATVLAFAGALLMWGLTLWLGHRARIAARVWGFAALALALGPGLLVNAVLKSLWGRARPADVAEFGGSLAFSPPFQIAGECDSNCSFVSGEAAGVAMLAMIIGELGWHLLPQHRHRRFAGVLIAAAVLAALMRVATGRHFLSDVIFAAFLMAFVALALYRLMGIAQARHSLTTRNLRSDAAMIARTLTTGR